MINLTDYNDFFLFLGGFLVIVGVIYLLFRHSLQNIFIAEQEAERLISEEEVSKLRISNQVSTPKISFPEKSKNISYQPLTKKLSLMLLVIIIGAFLFNQFLIWRMNSSNFLSKLFNINITITKK